jgi:acyl carrier protein
MTKLDQILARVLSVDPNTITDETSPKDVPTWDSFNALMLVSELELVFQVRFSMAEVVGVKCVGDIKRALIKHGVALEQ